MTAYTTTSARSHRLAINPDRLRQLVSIHFDTRWGASFWIDRARLCAINPASDLRCFDDLALLGDLEAHQLQSRPLKDYIPRRYHDQINQMILGQTGGATGPGTWTAYRDDEFEAAFVKPFASAAASVCFPRNERWLFIGPSGPHIIAKAAPRLARSMDSLDPFSVDFDPRWARKLPRDSTASLRYTQHVVDQAMQVIQSQDVGVLFATPPVLEHLAIRMSDIQRQNIRGVHYGGVSLDAQKLHTLQTQSFPNAVHLSGYGNTLLGCCLELKTDVGRTPTYFPHGQRLIIETLDSQGHPTPFGSPGRLRVTRLDETMLIVRLIERDVAGLIAPPDDAPPGFTMPGVTDPIPYETDVLRAGNVGLY